MNGEAHPKAGSSDLVPSEASRGMDPPPKVSESPPKRPFLKQENDSGETVKPRRTSYKLEIRNHCIECQPEGMAAIRNCECLECPLAQYRPYVSNGYREAEEEIRKGLHDGDEGSAGGLPDRILRARDRVLEKAGKFCPGKVGHFKRAYSGRSRKAALVAEKLYLANFNPSEARQLGV